MRACDRARRDKRLRDQGRGVDASDLAASRWRSFRIAVSLYVFVALGSVIGGSARWLAAEAMHSWLGAGLPWGTLFVNVTGSFLIGFYAALTGPDGRLLVGPVQRQFVMTGICGGYTTFSIFSLESLHLLQAGEFGFAGFNIGVSVVGWLAAVWLGYALASRINLLKGA